MLLGIDASTYLEGLSRGAAYYDGDRRIDPLDALRANGADVMRIRLWNGPWSAKGEPYLAGTCDLNNFLRLGHLAAGKGFRLLLDFHWSDFWADPKKQVPPKGWAGLDPEGLEKALYRYTREVLETVRDDGLDLAYIQAGNEITNGILWPAGALTERPEGGVRDGYPALVRLLKAGISACREVFPAAQIILHLERSGDGAVYQEFFGQMEQHGVDYDIIGASYYPWWHGPFQDLFANLDGCARFGRPRMVMETSYPFTMEDYLPGEDLFASAPQAPHVPPFPPSPAGQAEFLSALLEGCRAHGVAGVFYWEPLWLPWQGSCWASEEAQRYIGEADRPTRNEWANQCLFDYKGQKLPAFDLFRP